jgi:hypothetical protein
LIGLRNTIVVMGVMATATALLYAVVEGGWPGLRPDARLSAGTQGGTEAGVTLEDDVDLVGSPAASA